LFFPSQDLPATETPTLYAQQRGLEICPLAEVAAGHLQQKKYLEAAMNLAVVVARDPWVGLD
jgi:hypothetical protein